MRRRPGFPLDGAIATLPSVREVTDEALHAREEVVPRMQACHGRTPTGPKTLLGDPVWVTSKSGYAINVPYLGDPQRRTYAWVFGSVHTGGAHFLMTDGTVRFISENIDYPTFVWINRTKEGVPVGEF